MSIITVTDAYKQRQANRQAAAFDYFSNKVIALYADKRGRKEAIVRQQDFFTAGSGVLIKVSERKFLVTAGHVLQSAIKSPFWFMNDGKFESFGGSWRTIREKEGDMGAGPFDFGWIELEEELASKISGCRFVSEDRISWNQFQSSGRGYTVIGYPQSKNKKFLKDIKMGVYSYTGNGVNPDNKNLEKYVDHVFVEYDCKSIVSSNGSHQNPISIEGISGGAFVDLGNFNSAESLSEKSAPPPILAGITIEYLKKHNLLVGISARRVLEDIKRECKL